ncbi:MAG TPA: hypothetical protein PKL44_00275 [Candidatus Dojkabacteria bacterium]|nr:hypothetical protein [Candidatus Dojkabacteria bacterium]
MEKNLTLINIGTVSITTGTEGPKHDPYGYTEYSFTHKGEDIVIHLGLREEMIIGSSKTYGYDNITIAFADRFNHTITLSEFLSEVDETMHTPPSCECGCQEGEWVSGFPGEHLYICSKCKNVLDSEFHESEII